MAKFRFRLEKVLTLRLDELKIREGELRIAQAEVTRVENIIHDTIQQSNGQLVSEGSVVRVEEYVLRSTRLEWLRKQLEAARKALLDAKKVLSEARERYVEAKKEVRVLEKLKEKKQQSFLEEQDKKEQSATDEMSTMRRVRS